jgi:hypothetical protein
MATAGWRRTALLTPRARRALAAEAVHQHASAGESVRLDRSPDEDLQRGSPARYLESAPGGSRLCALYHAPQLTGLLRRLTGLEWERSGERAAFSYYRREGHHLDLHRDIDICDLAVITCIHESGAPREGLSGALCLWPSRTDARLSSIRGDQVRGRVPVRLAPGECIILLGGLVPHCLQPLRSGHVRIVAPLCFKLRNRPSNPAARSIGRTSRDASLSAITGAGDRRRRQPTAEHVELEPFPEP